ncbi:hypothetical protein CNY67_02070 [Desulfovibrio sp. G11]|nr:hypothetical protein CNY67_02070 [Desulfovibrio sp. G11]
MPGNIKVSSVRHGYASWLYALVVHLPAWRRRCRGGCRSGMLPTACCMLQCFGIVVVFSDLRPVRPAAQALLHLHYDQVWHLARAWGFFS